jgi:hypothetical protein
VQDIPILRSYLGPITSGFSKGNNAGEVALNGFLGTAVAMAGMGKISPEKVFSDMVNIVRDELDEKYGY